VPHPADRNEMQLFTTSSTFNCQSSGSTPGVSLSIRDSKDPYTHTPIQMGDKHSYHHQRLMVFIGLATVAAVAALAAAAVAGGPEQ